MLFILKQRSDVTGILKWANIQMLFGIGCLYRISQSLQHLFRVRAGLILKYRNTLTVKVAPFLQMYSFFYSAQT